MGSDSARCCGSYRKNREFLDSRGHYSLHIWNSGVTTRPRQLSCWLNYFHLLSWSAAEILESLSCYCSLRSVILPYFPLHRGAPWHQHRCGLLTLSEIAPVLPCPHPHRGVNPSQVSQLEKIQAEFSFADNSPCFLYWLWLPLFPSCPELLNIYINT